MAADLAQTVDLGQVGDRPAPSRLPAASNAPSPIRSRRRSDRPLRRRAALMLVVLALVGIAIAARGGDRHGGMTPVESLAADVQGTYRLADGRYLTLWGEAAGPGYEVGGRVTHLVAEGGDRYTSADGSESLTVERDRTGAVTGVQLTDAGGHETSGAPETLHVEEGVTFSSDDAELAGTLLVPTGAGPHPAVVIVHGAGRRDRETYRLLASHLARRGVAALIYDKRGTGASTGTVADATFDDLTDDALAGVELLTGHPQVDPRRVGTLGFSQGAWVVAQAARRSSDVAFVIAYSASGVSPADQAAWLHGSMLAARGFDRSGMHVADRVNRMLYSSLELVDAGLMPSIPNTPGFWFHALEPHLDSAALWEGVRQPVLAAWGERDCQVPAHDSRDALARTLDRGGNTDVTLAMLPGADHSFTLTMPCGHETGLGAHGGMQYADGYFALAANWINGLPTTGSRADDEADGPREGGVLGWHVQPPSPAPWYGSIAVQLTVILGLLGAFGFVAGRWVLGTARPGAHRSLPEHLSGASGLLGLAATAVGCAAITEIAMLGDVHAALLVGGPTVAGTSRLMAATPWLVTAAASTAAAAIVLAARQARRTDRAGWGGCVGAIAATILVGWAGYWSLLPLQ